jgi:diketogulonate reductase-like aldo/keto reductase
MEYIELNNGVKCPVIGIGTFMLSPTEAENSVREALKMGYSLVDTANAYVNERAVGRGIKDSGIKREDVFLSTKLWPSEYENPNAVDETLERLRVDYVDLLYIHQPAGNWTAGYRQLEKAYKEGKARAIGISNFEGKYIEELETKWEIAPQFIQVEAHPYFTQTELRRTLDKYGIKLMSWYPLGHGDKSLQNEPVFAELGKKYLNDVWDAIELNRSPRYVENYLRELGYLTDFTGEHWKIRLPQYKHFTRIDTLDERLTPEFIRQSCGSRAHYGNSHAEISYPPRMPQELEHIWQPHVHTTRIYRLYLRYCYELGILPKGTKYQPTSPFLREELRKLDMYDRETRFLAGSGIETLEELQAKIVKTQTEMDALADERKHVTYTMRRATPEKKAELQKQKAALTKQITPLREKLKLMRDIERRSEHIDRTLTRVYESEERALNPNIEDKNRNQKERTYER